MARFYFFILLILFFSSCSFFDKQEETPSYLRVEKFTVQTVSAMGTNSNNITEGWIYVNGDALGVFELPCTIPVLTEGTNRVTVFAGIKNDGITAIRVIYPYYTSYETNVDFTRGTIDTIRPTCTYFDPPYCNIDKEEFEDAGIKFVADAASIGNITKTNLAGEVFEDNYSGKIEMNAADLYLKSYYTTNFFFPGNGAAAYVELDYKNNFPFTIGMEITEPSNVVNTDNTIITPSYDNDGNLIWKKIYISLTELVNLHPNATNFRVYVKAGNMDGANGQIVLIDNFKVVYGL